MFYDIFVTLCRGQGISPSKAAEAVGLSRTSVVKWKNGSVPSGATAQKIAAYFDVSVDFLLGDAQKKAPAIPKHDALSEPIIILNRGARKMTLEQQQKLLEVARVMFKEEFKDE